MKIKILVFFVIIFLVLLFSYGNHAFAASFQGLGDLPGGSFNSQAYGVSADGSVVVGFSRSTDNNYEAFRWTESDGIMVGLGDLPGGIVHSEGVGISDDGSTVVGLSYSGLGGEAFRWTETEGMVNLHDLPGGRVYAYAGDASSDGSVVVGWSNSANNTYVNDWEAYRWTESGGMVGLGDLVGGPFYSEARGVSADGSVVVGISKSSYGGEAFRWTESGGMVGLGDLTGGGFGSYASDVSADGSVVVGWSYPALGTEAFLWTESEGMVGLGDLPGGNTASYAYGLSGDGSVVVGLSSSYSGNEIFVWDKTNGMRSLTDVLISDLSLDLTGWTLSQVKDISYDGKVIVGYGTNPDGNIEGWIANLEPTTPVPEPATMLLLGSGIIGLAGFRRKRATRGRR